MDTSEIISSLQRDKYSQQQIADALAQANMKSAMPFNKPKLNAPFPPVQGYQESDPLPQDDFSMEIPEPPAPPMATIPPKQPKKMVMPREERQMPQDTPRERVERIEEIAEAIVQEKWDDLAKSMGNISVWKEKVNMDILSLKQEVIRTQQRFDNLERAILGKMGKYDENVRDLGSEMKALEKVLDRILSPLTTNIKELGKITEELKKVKR